MDCTVRQRFELLMDDACYASPLHLPIFFTMMNGKSLCPIYMIAISLVAWMRYCTPAARALAGARQYLRLSNEHALNGMLSMYRGDCNLYGVTGTREDLAASQQAFYERYGPTLRYDAGSLRVRSEEGGKWHVVSFHFTRRWVEDGKTQSWHSKEHGVIEELSFDENNKLFNVELRPIES